MAKVSVEFLKSLPALQQASLIQQLMGEGMTAGEVESFFTGLSAECN